MKNTQRYFAVALAIGGMTSASVLADEIAVTNLNDSGEGSLRAAISQANASEGGDVIVFSGDAGSGVVNLQSRLPSIHGETVIEGPGADQLTVSGDSDGDGTADVAVFRASGDNAYAIISGLTVSHGRAGGGCSFHRRHVTGGGVASLRGATVELREVAVVHCVAEREHSEPEVLVAESWDDDDDSSRRTSSSSSNGGGGGGRFLSGAAVSAVHGNLRIEKCLIAHNRVGNEEQPNTVGAGAAIYLLGSPDNFAEIVNSTISNNQLLSRPLSSAHSGSIYVAKSHRWCRRDDDDDDDDDEWGGDGRPDWSDGGSWDEWFNGRGFRHCGNYDDLDIELPEHFPSWLVEGAGGDSFWVGIPYFDDDDDEESDDEVGRYSVALTNNTVADNSVIKGCAGLVVRGRGYDIQLTNNVFARNISEFRDEACNFHQRGGFGPFGRGHHGDDEDDDEYPHGSHHGFATSGGGNVFDDDSAAHILTETNDRSSDEGIALGELADNEGPTATHALGEGSSAIGNAVEGAPETDQRCLDRDGAPDSGAYEFGAGTGNVDEIPPVIAGMPDDFCVPTDAGSNTAVVEWDEPTATDNVGVVSFTSTHSSGDSFPLGVTEVVYTATDAAGNSASDGFTVEVKDEENPEIKDLPANIALGVDAGSTTAIATWDEPTACDNVGVVSFTSTHSSGDSFPIGVTTVTYTATDAAGNSISASFTVSVGDDDSPVITGMPADIVTNTDPGLPTAVVTWTEPTATDNVGVESLTSTHSPGDAFPVGVTTVTYTATDAAGNSTSESFTVTVNDNEKPVIDGLPEDIVVQAEIGSTTAVVGWTEPTATDNVGVESLTSTFSPGDSFPIGETIVTYTATDAAGNACLASFLVTVEEPPNAFFLDFISVTGDPVPGATDATFSSYGTPFMNNNDQVTFRGTIVGGGTGASDNDGVWVGDVNALDVIAREGSTAPGAGVDFRRFEHLNITDDDEVSFVAQLIGAGVSGANDFGYYPELGAAPLDQIGREGDVAPDTGGATFRFLNDPVSGSGGVTAIGGQLVIAGAVSASNDTGVWSNHGGAFAKVVREGDPAPDLPAGAVLRQVNSNITMNGSGQLTFQANVVGAGPNNLSVFSGQPGAFSLIAGKGQVAPDTGGGTFGNFLSNSTSGSGQVAVRASLLNSAAAGVSAANNEGIWASVDGVLELVAREGDQVPNAPAGVVFQRFVEFGIADDGSVSFSGFVSGPGVGSTNDGGLWTTAGGSLRTIVREGDMAPGTSGGLIQSILSFAVNNDGFTGFVSRLVPNIGDTTNFNNVSLSLSNPDTGELDLALRTSSTFEFAPGDDRSITGITIGKSTNVSGGTGGAGRTLNDLNNLTIRLTFTNGSGVFVIGRNLAN